MDPSLDKENIKVQTKIPLPLAPLPPLPQHLLKKLSARPPLNTIAGPSNQNDLNRLDQNQQSLAGPSTARNELIRNRVGPYKQDTKLVTVKRGCQDSIYNYMARHETRKESVLNISISDDEEETNAMGTLVTDKDGFSYWRADTPVPQTLQPAREKNIQRSLKRQGISPMPNRDKVKRRINFNQSVHDRMLPPDYLQESYTEAMDREYAADILSNLLQSEAKPAAPPKVRDVNRASIVNWFMEINGLDGKPATIQVAIWYLDSVLSSGHVALKDLHLIATACYWIATKIQGPSIRASKMVQYANNAFEKLRLLGAETVILEKLKFPRLTVVAQEFLYYFARWCNKERPGEIEVAATFLCLCGMMVDKSLYQEYPSVVAAASIRNALLLLQRKELIPRLQSCSVFVAAEKKASNFSHTCSILRDAVRTVASKDYKYNFIMKQYGTPPKHIAQTIVSAANELAIVDHKSSTMIF